MQVDTEIFDVLVKDTGRTKQELHDWAKTENELKEICTPEEIAGDVTCQQRYLSAICLTAPLRRSQVMSPANSAILAPSVSLHP